MMMKRPTIKQLDAVISAVTAMLAGEEGEGDWDHAHSADDMEAGLQWLKEQRDRLALRAAVKPFDFRKTP